jgi:hypothetical protein
MRPAGLKEKNNSTINIIWNNIVAMAQYCIIVRGGKVRKNNEL